MSHQEHQNGGKLAADQRGVPDPRIKPAPIRVRDFRQIGDGRTIFAAHTDALQDA